MFVYFKIINLLSVKLENDKYDYIFIDKYVLVENMLKYYNELVMSNNWVSFKEINEDVLIVNKVELYSISVVVVFILVRD